MISITREKREGKRGRSRQIPSDTERERVFKAPRMRSTRCWRGEEFERKRKRIRRRGREKKENLTESISKKKKSRKIHSRMMIENSFSSLVNYMQRTLEDNRSMFCFFFVFFLFFLIVFF